MIQSKYNPIQLIVFFLVVTMLGCQDKSFKEDLAIILGINKIDVEKVQSNDEFGGFGEGYTLEIYKLSESSINDFNNVKYKRIPVKAKDGVWQKYGWSKTPIDSLYKEIVSMPLNYYSGNKKLEVILNKIKKIIQKDEIYYSFYYKPDKINPQRVQLFILDIQSRDLYAIDIAI